MGRRGNPYDSAMAESLMKTLKVEGIYPMAFETREDVAEHLPRFIEKYNNRSLHSALGYRSLIVVRPEGPTPDPAAQGVKTFHAGPQHVRRAKVHRPQSGRRSRALRDPSRVQGVGRDSPCGCLSACAVLLAYAGSATTIARPGFSAA
jgi:hypothetical protein